MNQMKAFILFSTLLTAAICFEWGGSNSKKDEPKFKVQGILKKKEEKKMFGCFPSSAMVRVNNASIRIATLRVGQVIDTGPGKKAPVYMFSHRKFDGVFEFLALHTSNGNLTASPGHHVYTQHGEIPARDVKPGDLLTTARDHQERVVRIERVLEKGLFNPHTMDGSIVVNGFVASTFTEAVPQNAASSLLAPIRAAYMASNGRDLTMGALESGCPLRRTLFSSLIRF